MYAACRHVCSEQIYTSPMSVLSPLLHVDVAAKTGAHAQGGGMGSAEVGKGYG